MRLYKSVVQNVCLTPQRSILLRKIFNNIYDLRACQIAYVHGK